MIIVGAKNSRDSHPGFAKQILGGCPYFVYKGY